MFAELGVLVIDADVLAHEAVEPGTPALAQIAQRWPQVVREGRLDRPALAAIVFNDATARDALNAIVHPVVRAHAEALERAAPSDAIVMHVVPLLFESDYWKSCDATVVVIAKRETRLQRVRAREGLSDELIEKRMAAQIDPEEARARAGFVIENDGDLAHLRSEVARVYALLCERRAGATGRNAR